MAARGRGRCAAGRWADPSRPGLLDSRLGLDQPEQPQVALAARALDIDGEGPPKQLAPRDVLCLAARLDRVAGPPSPLRRWPPLRSRPTRLARAPPDCAGCCAMTAPRNTASPAVGEAAPSPPAARSEPTARRSPLRTVIGRRQSGQRLQGHHASLGRPRVCSEGIGSQQG